MFENHETEGDNLQILQSDLHELAKDYAQYLQVDASKERQSFYNSIEEMLTKLDEFGGLVDTIRSDTSLCVDKSVQDIQEKCEEMKQIFHRIDQLEEFVKIVRRDVANMEECVIKAENEMGSFSSFKKIFSSLVGGKKSSQSRVERTEFKSPDIFVTEQYLHPAQCAGAMEQSVSVDNKSQDDPNVQSSSDT